MAVANKERPSETTCPSSDAAAAAGPSQSFVHRPTSRRMIQATTATAAKTTAAAITSLHPMCPTDHRSSVTWISAPTSSMRSGPVPSVSEV